MRLTGPKRSRALLFLYTVAVSAGATLATILLTPQPPTYIRIEPMNTYKVTMYIKTWSEDPEDWIVDAVSQDMEADEEIESIKVQRIESIPF